MDFNEFKERAASEIGKMLGDGQAELREVKRNNGITLTGLMPTRQGAWICPVITLEKYYAKLCQGADFGQVIRTIWQKYLENKDAPSINITPFIKWELAKQNVEVKLVNYEENTGLLATIPHKKFLDLAEVYYYALPISGPDFATILINSQHMKMWGVSSEELAKQAYENSIQHFPIEIKNIEELLRNFLDMKPLGTEENVPMYMITNRQFFNGASAMLFPEEWKELADKWESDLYILPSSIHELIALPACEETPDSLAKIVREINISHVLPEEKLSDTVYRYHYESGRIEIA